MELLRLASISIVLIAFSSCQKQPTACVNIEDAVEAGSFIKITSCSEDYEFLTWRFDDDLSAQVGDEVQRTFVTEDNHSVTLTAYAKNGYRSDEITVDFKSSYRYVDYVEIVGDSPYSKFIVKCFSSFNATQAEGSFSNSTPYIFQVYPQNEVRILPEISKVELTGVRSIGSQSFLGSQSFNFETYKENPITLITDGFEMRLHWRFKD